MKLDELGYRMVRKLAAGNWKMHGLSTGLDCIEAISAGATGLGCDVALALPATLLSRAAAQVGGRIALAGQDCHFATSGAHTGDVSAAMLADAGASHVILGHSERRADHGETDAAIAAKLAAAQGAGLCAILCLGETLAQREAGQTLAVVAAQLAGSLPDSADPGRLVLAYEPVWAIGTGLTPSLAQIAEVHGFLRAELAQRFGAAAAGAIALLYGGSVKPDNAAAIFALDHVDGALVGGASLEAAGFLAIARALEAA